MSNLTIVMYHYVRPIKESKFPGIKGLELEGFKRQLDYLSENQEQLEEEFGRSIYAIRLKASRLGIFNPTACRACLGISIKLWSSSVANPSLKR